MFDLKVVCWLLFYTNVCMLRDHIWVTSFRGSIDKQ